LLCCGGGLMAMRIGDVYSGGVLSAALVSWGFLLLWRDLVVFCGSKKSK
jgi:hypothetical protein